MDKTQAEKLLDKAERAYLLRSGDAFTFSIRYTARDKADYPAYERNLAKHPFIEVATRRIVTQGFVRVPRPGEVRISVPALLKERPEITPVKNAFDRVRLTAKSLDIDEFLHRNFADCRRKYEILVPALEILEYLLENRESVHGLFTREVPHQHSTKIIGHEGLLLRMWQFAVHEAPSVVSGWEAFLGYFGLRVKGLSFQFHGSGMRFDGNELNDFHGILTPERRGRWDFSSFRAALIIENEESFLSLQGSLPDCLLLFGAGNMISGGEFLKDILPERRLYWGDMDAEGYEILERAREVLGHLETVCMSPRYVHRYRRLNSQPETGVRGKSRRDVTDRAHRLVLKHNLRIEQEKIPRDEVIAAVGERLESS